MAESKKKFTVDTRKTNTGTLVRSVVFDNAEDAVKALNDYCKNNDAVSNGWPGYHGKPYYAELGVCYE